MQCLWQVISVIQSCLHSFSFFFQYLGWGLMAWADKGHSWFAYKHRVSNLCKTQDVTPKHRIHRGEDLFAVHLTGNWYNAGKKSSFGALSLSGHRQKCEELLWKQFFPKIGRGMCVWGCCSLDADCDGSAKFTAPNSIFPLDLVPRLQNGEEWFCWWLGSPHLWGVF